MGHQPATYEVCAQHGRSALGLFVDQNAETLFHDITLHVGLVIMSRTSKSVDVPRRQHRRLRVWPGARSKVRPQSL
jgi:hypothetical protein